MGLINTALSIGQSAITSYQSALSVVGNNIANAANPDYTRQRAVLQPVVGAPLPGGIQPGGGVALTSLERIINEALEGRLRLALGDTESARIQSNTLTQIETGFNELTDNDLSTMMSRLFNSFQDVQNNPTDVGLRSVAIGNAAALADALRIRQQGLSGLADELNTQIVASVQQADDFPAYIGIFVVGHLLAPVVIMMISTFGMSAWLTLAIILPVSVVMLIAMLQPVKGAVIGMLWWWGVGAFKQERRKVEPTEKP